MAKFHSHILQVLSHQSSFKRKVAIRYILNLVCVLPFPSDAWGALMEMGGTGKKRDSPQNQIRAQNRLVPEMCMSLHPFQVWVSVLLISLNWNLLPATSCKTPAEPRSLWSKAHCGCYSEHTQTWAWHSFKAHSHWDAADLVSLTFL